ncbi:hypothetical protein F1735_30955 [Massilia sp. CCM 8694]|uniref:Uncharacterized protein n=1 Tax=Massilia genomosp. 1 TaxID=2609280 RepID=A0ABX0MV79_9BURK|nr:hypothetical protein [Massilia genomosp. 1]
MAARCKASEAAVTQDGNRRQRLWTCVRDDKPSSGSTLPAVWFAYTPDLPYPRSGKNCPCIAHSKAQA